MEVTWTIEVNRFFIETADVNKKGNPVMIPVTIRKLTLRGDFIQTNRYEVNVIKRHGEQKFCVKQIVPPKKPLWPVLVLNTLPDPIKWKREGSYTYEQFVKWLSSYVHNSEQVTNELLECPPQNLAA